MQHLHLMQKAAPIFKDNPDGGAYLITSSVAVRRCRDSSGRWDADG